MYKIVLTNNSGMVETIADGLFNREEAEYALAEVILRNMGKFHLCTLQIERSDRDANIQTSRKIVGSC